MPYMKIFHLKNSITYILESKEVINQLKDLESMTDEIRRIEQQIDRASEADIIDSAMNMQLNLLGEEWNTLNNKIVDMENELHEKKPYKTYIRQWIGKNERSNGKMAENNGYKYYSIHRPVSIGTYPKDYDMVSFENYKTGREYVEEIGREAWGELTYNHSLTEQDMDEYELLQTEEQRQMVYEEENGQREAVYLYGTNPRFDGTNEQGFVQRYYQGNGTRIPADVVFMGSAERSLEVVNGLNSGRITAKQAIDEWQDGKIAKGASIDMIEYGEMAANIARLDFAEQRGRNDNILFEELTVHLSEDEKVQLRHDYNRSWNRVNTQENSNPKMAILQLREGDENHNRRFLGIDELQRYTGEVPEADNYEIIFVERLEQPITEPEAMSVLENTYSRFNQNTPRPSNYYGHSLSKGDVVVLAKDSLTMEAYFVDGTEFTKLPEFLNEKLKAKITLNMDVEKEHQIYMDMLGFSLENETYGLISQNAERRSTLNIEYVGNFELARKRGVMEQSQKLDTIHNFELKQGGEQNEDNITVFNETLDRVMLKMDIVNDLSAEELQALVDNSYEQAIENRLRRETKESGSEERQIFVPNQEQMGLLNALYSGVVTIIRYPDDKELQADMREKLKDYAISLDELHVPWAVQNAVAAAGEKRENWGRYNESVINEICNRPYGRQTFVDRDSTDIQLPQGGTWHTIDVTRYKGENYYLMKENNNDTKHVIVNTSGSFQLDVTENGFVDLYNYFIEQGERRDWEITEQVYEDGYLHFQLEVDGYGLDGLFRVHDPENGDSMKLVSIDYGMNHPSVGQDWTEIENTLKAYARDKFEELTRPLQERPHREESVAQLATQIEEFLTNFDSPPFGYAEGLKGQENQEQWIETISEDLTYGAKWTRAELEEVAKDDSKELNIRDMAVLYLKEIENLNVVYGRTVSIYEGKRELSQEDLDIIVREAKENNRTALELPNCFLMGLDVQGDFSHANFSNTRFASDCRFINADFTNANFEESVIYADVSKSKFNNVNFNKAGIYQSQFRDTSFNKVDFSQTQFRHVSFYNSNLKNIDYQNGTMESVYFRETVIEGEQKNIDTINITMGGATNEEVENHRQQIINVLKNGTMERSEQNMAQEPEKDNNLVASQTELTARERVTEQLKEGIKNVMDSDNFKNYLRTSGRLYFNNYSLRNAILVYHQKPQSTYVMGYEKWKEFGRQVKQNTTGVQMGVKILAPVFAYEKQSGGLYKQIMGNLNEQLKKDPALPTAAYNVGQSKVSFTLDKSGMMGLRIAGSEVQRFVERDHSDVRRFIGRNIIGKIPMYYNVATVFDVADTFEPEHVWLKNNFKKEDMVRDENGQPVKNFRGEYKIVNTAERKAQFNANLDFTIPEADSVKMELLYDVLQKVSADKGVPMEIVSPEQDETLKSGADGYYQRQPEGETGKGKIVLSSELPLTNRVAVAFHEMSHADLHSNLAKLEAQLGEKADQNMREVQAEASAYTTAQNFGIETQTSSFNYLAVWSKGRELPELEKSLEVIYRESKALMQDIEKELDKRGLTIRLEPKEQLPLTQSEKEVILKKAYEFVLNEAKANENLSKDAVELLEDTTDPEQQSIIKQQMSVVQKCSGEITTINILCDELIKSQNRAEQILAKQKINAAMVRCEQFENQFNSLSDMLVSHMEENQTNLKTEFRKDPRGTLDTLKIDYKGLENLSEQDMQYIAKSGFIAREYAKLLKTDPQEFVNKALQQLERTRAAISKNGTFVEINYSEDVFTAGTVAHPKIVNKMMEQAEMQIRGLRLEAESKGEYYPYAKCNLTVFSPTDRGMLAYNTRIDMGDGEQKNLMEHMQEMLKGGGDKGTILEHMVTSLRERAMKGKIQEPSLPESKADMETAKEEDNGQALEEWKKEIDSARTQQTEQDKDETNQEKGSIQPERG